MFRPHQFWAYSIWFLRDLYMLSSFFISWDSAANLLLKCMHVSYDHNNVAGSSLHRPKFYTSTDNWYLFNNIKIYEAAAFITLNSWNRPYSCTSWWGFESRSSYFLFSLVPRFTNVSGLPYKNKQNENSCTKAFKKYDYSKLQIWIRGKSVIKY